MGVPVEVTPNHPGSRLRRDPWRLETIKKLQAFTPPVSGVACSTLSAFQRENMAAFLRCVEHRLCHTAPKPDAAGVLPRCTRAGGRLPPRTVPRGSFPSQPALPPTFVLCLCLPMPHGSCAVCRATDVTGAWLCSLFGPGMAAARRSSKSMHRCRSWWAACAAAPSCASCPRRQRSHRTTTSNQPSPLTPHGCAAVPPRLARPPSLYAVRGRGCLPSRRLLFCSS